VRPAAVNFLTLGHGAMGRNHTHARISSLLIGLALFALVPPALATRGGVPTYPKIATYVYGVGDFSPALQETLSWFDAVSTRARPEVIAEMRARNPHQRIFYMHMPQSIANDNDDETFWFPDTSWSLERLCQFYALQNDWYLYDIYGAKMEQWSVWVANWTRYCPLGTYGTSVGMTYAQWYIDVALPQIALHSTDEWGEPWGWGSSAYDGLAWETFYECPACCVADQFKDADPDRDGLPEGIDGTCFDGDTASDSLRILYRETNDDFYQRMQTSIPTDLVINVNRGGTSLNPSWAWELNGLKLENWSPSRTNPTQSWWSWMYGRRNPWKFIGDGYQFAERYMDRSGVDELDGWDVSWIHVYTRGQDWHPFYASRMVRFGVGTSLLGDGYFVFTKEQHYPEWFPEFEYDFGQPLEDYQRELDEADTLYVRRFTKGIVEVNPYPRGVGGVPPEDSRFGFWLTLQDLAVENSGPDYITLTWVVPTCDVNDVEAFEIRYATTPITPETWDAATPAQLGSIQGEPGERIHYSVRELASETAFYFAAKNVVHGRLEPLISNVVSATTGPAEPPPPPEEDTTPPAVITDLASPAQGVTWLDLTWSAPGDDGMSGTAHHYQMRYRVGGAIENETAWNSATPVSAALPEPGAPGTLEEFQLTGLDAGTTYGVAVRAFDEEGNRSALSNPLAVATASPPPPPPPPEEDTLAPDAIVDLSVDGVTETSVTLQWTCPGDDGAGGGQAHHFILAWREGGAIDTEDAWNACEMAADGLPAPQDPGQLVSYTLAGLSAGVAYNAAVRAYDEAGNRAALGNSIPFETPVPPDETAPAAIDDLHSVARGVDWLDLTWTAPGDDEWQGVAAGYRLRYRAGGAIVNESDWSAADSATGLPAPATAGATQTFQLDGLAAQTLYGVAIRAVDETGNLADLSNAYSAMTAAPPDTFPPVAIEDLMVTGVTTDGFSLAWTAPGDDGEKGTAARYVLAHRAGEGIADEDDWEAAVRESLDAPLPLASGTPQACVLEGLEGGTLYGLALRAIDEAGNVSAIAAIPLEAQTLAPPPPPPPPPQDVTLPAQIQDLALASARETTLDLTWTAPGDDGMLGTATGFVLAWVKGTLPIDSEERWNAATLVHEGLPEPPVAGSAVAWSLIGLEPGSSYALAVRAYDDVGLVGPISNSLIAETLAPPPEQDTTPPAAIEDLALAAVTPSTAELRWSSPGDDGMSGRAERFVFAWRAGAGIESESDWAAADTLENGLPEPGDPGEEVSFRLTGLAAATAYSVAVRARDEGGRLSPLGPALDFTTLAPPDTLPPARVIDLTAHVRGAHAVLLTCTASGDDGLAGSAGRVIVARRGDQLIETETDWTASAKDTLVCSTAGGEPDSLLLETLASGIAWGFALRYLDDAQLAGEISNFVALSVPGDPAGTDTIPPAAVADLRASSLEAGGLTLCWSPVGDDSLAGDAAGYFVAILPGERMSDAGWDRAEHASIGSPTGRPAEVCQLIADLVPGESYGLAVRAFDEAGNLAALGTTLWVPELAPCDPSAPEAVNDLVATETGPDWVHLAWTSPASGRAACGVDRVEIAYARAPLDDQMWAAAESVITLDEPAPSGEQQTLRITSLVSGQRYWFTLRSDNGLGYRSPLSNGVEAQTSPEDEVAPGAPQAPQVTLNEDGAHVDVAWSPVPDEDVSGYNVYGRASGMSVPQRLNADPIAATEWDFERPFGEGDFYVSVTAVDAAGNESAMSPEASLFPTEIALDGPFPHPIEDEARFVLSLPPDPGGAFQVRAEIFSVSGRSVRRWIDEPMPAGLETTLWWDTRADGGEPVAPGLYFLKLTAGEKAIVKKIYVGR
jgi:chitodextrinase